MQNKNLDLDQEGKKKVYTTPQLTIHGSVEKITNGYIIKTFGVSDGFIYMGQGLSTVVS